MRSPLLLPCSLAIGQGRPSSPPVFPPPMRMVFPTILQLAALMTMISLAGCLPALAVSGVAAALTPPAPVRHGLTLDSLRGGDTGRVFGTGPHTRVRGTTWRVHLRRADTLELRPFTSGGVGSRDAPPVVLDLVNVRTLQVAQGKHRSRARAVLGPLLFGTAGQMVGLLYGATTREPSDRDGRVIVGVLVGGTVGTVLGVPWGRRPATRWHPVSLTRR